MNSLKKGEGVPLLNFEGGPGVPLLNFEGGPEVLVSSVKGITKNELQTRCLPRIFSKCLKESSRIFAWYCK